MENGRIKTKFKLTKPHQKVKQFMIDENIYSGFESEKQIKANNRFYHPDEINKEKMLIIEIFGDYWHCNPSKFNSEYINKSVNKIAKEIWKYDREKISNYKREGYSVLVIWEEDINENLEEIKKKIRRKDKWIKYAS